VSVWVQERGCVGGESQVDANEFQLSKSRTIFSLMENSRVDS
jgi:hypothetical protein